MNAPITTFRLKHVAAPNDGNEILTGLRLLFEPGVKIYLDNHENTIIMRALPEEVAEATTLIAQLDRPRQTYRVTITLTDFDGTRKLSSSDYTLTVLDGQRATLKQGSRIPVVTGRYEPTGGSAETQMSYLDIGRNFDLTVTSSDTGAILREKIEQSSRPDGQAPGTTDPILHQTVTEAVLGRPLSRATPIATLEEAKTTYRIEVSARLERLP